LSTTAGKLTLGFTIIVVVAIIAIFRNAVEETSSVGIVQQPNTEEETDAILLDDY
jgi:hypothetical protein